MLRIARIGISVIILLLITFYFIDFTEILPNSFHRLAHVQFVPALISFSVGILLVLIVLTLVFGRIYCSTLCPLGTFQDVARRASGVFRKKKKRHAFSPALTFLRWGVVGVTLVTFLCHFPLVLGLLDPYSAYGRIVVNVFRPVYFLGNNLLEFVFSHFENYTFYKVDTSLLDVASFGIAFVTFITIGVLAWRHGRTWCNTMCPVGTILGLLSRFSLFKIRIDVAKCNHCGVCATRCKASCINSSAQSIDSSRCVDCFDCLGACKQQALVYKPSFSLKKQPTERIESASDASKRRFLIAGLTTAGVAPQIIAQQAFAGLGEGKAYTKEHPITPPGSISREHFESHCTSCHLCVSKCQSHVLQPAFMEYGLGGVMQPTVGFKKGFCNYDCTICGDVCPTGAIQPLTIEEKHLTQMGYVVFIKENCIVYRNGTSCGACSEHCPTQAIAMIPFKDGLTIPQVDTSICVGCGGCEYVCPAHPFSAVHIEGNAVQKKAKPIKEAEQEHVEIDSFGF